MRLVLPIAEEICDIINELSNRHSKRRDTHSHSHTQEESFVSPYDSLHTAYEQPPRWETRQSHGLYDKSDDVPINETADTRRGGQDSSSPQRKTSNLYASSNLNN